MIYMLDTNILSYLLEGNESVKTKLLSVLNGNTVLIPEIVYYEIQRGLKYKNAVKKQDVFSQFCQIFGIAYMNKETLDLASSIYADLRKTGNQIEDDDIFIGATALEQNAILVTNNEKHLGRIQNLQIENWCD